MRSTSQTDRVLNDLNLPLVHHTQSDRRGLIHWSGFISLRVKRSPFECDYVTASDRLILLADGPAVTMPHISPWVVLIFLPRNWLPDNFNLSLQRKPARPLQWGKEFL